MRNAMVRSPTDEELREERRSRQTRPLAHAFNRIIISLANAVLAGTLLSQTIKAFAMNGELGIRSLATAALPPIVVAYFAFFSRGVKPAQRSSEISYFLVFAGWIMLLLMFINFEGVTYNLGMLLGQFALSTTLSIWILLARSLSFRAVLSSSYGILSGFLLYILLFGIPAY